MKCITSIKIPHCWKTLSQKILRTVFVNKMWQNATEPMCILYEPTECGWQLNSENKLEPLWYKGPAAPLKVEEILRAEMNTEESEGESEEDEELRTRNHWNEIDFDD